MNALTAKTVATAIATTIIFAGIAWVLDTAIWNVLGVWMLSAIGGFVYARSAVNGFWSMKHLYAFNQIQNIALYGAFFGVEGIIVALILDLWLEVTHGREMRLYCEMLG